MSRIKFHRFAARSSSTYEDLKEGSICRQGSSLFFGRRKLREWCYCLASFPPSSSVRFIRGFALCLRSFETTVECLEPFHVPDPLPVEGTTNFKILEAAGGSSHIATTEVRRVEDHEATPLLLQRANDGTSEASPLQRDADMKVKMVSPQGNASMDAVSTTAKYDYINSTGLACESQGDSETTFAMMCTSEYEAGLAKDSEHDDGERVARAMPSSVEINVSSIPSFSSEDSQTVQDICAFLDSKGWDTNTENFLSNNHPYLSRMVVSMVIHRQKGLHVAKSFFEWACRKVGHESFSYHALLVKLGLNKQYDDAWELINRMKETGCQVSETTFCILIKACGAVHSPEMALTAFNKMYDYGVVAGTHTFTTLISMFFKLRMLGEVHVCCAEVIADAANLDLQFFSTLIQGFGNMGKIRDAQACFNMMSYYSLRPDLSSFNSLIEAQCCCNALQSAMSTFRVMQKGGFQPNNITFNTIIKVLCKSGKVAEAMSVFADLKRSDNVQLNQATYNILLQGMLAKEELSEAINFFKQMSREGFVDSRSCIYLSNRCRQMRQTGELLDVLLGVCNSPSFAKIEVCNALIHNLSELNAIDEAKKVFKQMASVQKHPSISSYAIMISCFCRAEKPKDAIGLLVELTGRGCVPSSCCYVPIIFYFLMKNRSLDAHTYLQEMWALGVDCDHTTYELLLDEICKQCMIEDAMKICDLMVKRKFTLTVNVLFELMKCITRLQGIEFGILYFQRLYNQERLPDCSAVSQALAVMKLYTLGEARL